MEGGRWEVGHATADLPSPTGSRRTHLPTPTSRRLSYFYDPAHQRKSSAWSNKAFGNSASSTWMPCANTPAGTKINSVHSPVVQNDRVAFMDTSVLEQRLPRVGRVIGHSPVWLTVRRAREVAPSLDILYYREGSQKNRPVTVGLPGSEL